ncbi:Imm1 family immunity protein [Micromonospora sp. NPDC051141]|uniref:Imm1 family immunity protein n=1 Tax=Micromonospora sp. NPDC051141 TaxID=3364284 RepID=UPI003799D0E3
MGVGHAERSFVYHVAVDGSSAWGYQPDLQPGPAFTFDYAGTPTDAWPERTRITNATVRQAARQVLTADGQRPPRHWPGKPSNSSSVDGLRGKCRSRGRARLAGASPRAVTPEPPHPEHRTRLPIPYSVLDETAQFVCEHRSA